MKLPGKTGGSKAFLAAALLAALSAAALRAAYSLLPPPGGDGGSYLAAAGGILSGDYFFSGAAETFGRLYRTPGYPLFLAALDQVSGGSRLFLVLAQHLLGLLSAFLAYSTAKKIWGRPAGALAFLFAGLHYHFVYLESYPLSEPLAVFLLLASLRLLLYAGEAGRGAAALCGLAAGAGALCRSELAGLIPVYAAYLYFGRAGARKPKPAAAFLLPALLMLGAWTLRNGLLFDYWGLTPNSAIAFFDGPAGACARGPCGPADPVCTQALAHKHDDGRVNRAALKLEKFGIPYQWSARRIGDLAVSGAAGAPACYAAGVLAQFRPAFLTGNTWPPLALTETMAPLAAAAPSGPATVLERLGRIDGALEGFLLVPLFLGGCLAALARRRREELLPAAAALLLLLSYLFFSPYVPRYRVVPEALMGLTAAGFLMYAWNAALRRPAPAGEGGGSPRPPGRWLPAAALAVAAVLLAAFLAGLFRAALLGARRSEADCRKAAGAGAEICRGYARLARGKFPAALESFDAALALAPADKTAGDGRAAALFRMGRGAEALAQLERGLGLHGPAPDILFNMAVIEHLSGSPAAAGRLDSLLGRRDLPPAIRAAALEMRLAPPGPFYKPPPH